MQFRHGIMASRTTTATATDLTDLLRDQENGLKEIDSNRLPKGYNALVQSVAAAAAASSAKSVAGETKASSSVSSTVATTVATTARPATTVKAAFNGSSSTIQLVPPLTKEQVALDNGGGGNWGAAGIGCGNWGRVRKIKTIDACSSIVGGGDGAPSSKGCCICF